MTDYNRGRVPLRDYDNNFYDNDNAYERPPRHRSMGRQALDKLEDAMSGLGLESSRSSKALIPYKHQDVDYHHHHHHHHRRPSSPGGYYRGRGSHWDRDRDRAQRRAYHSSSPTRHHSHHHHRGRHESRTAASTSSRSRSRWGRGIHAAVDAAAIEAYRLRNEPGSWNGAGKRERIATAAISAGVIGAASEDTGHEGGKRGPGPLVSAIGGLVVNRIVNGPRRELRQ